MVRSKQKGPFTSTDGKSLTHPARPEHMAGQVMSPVRFLYAKAFTTQGPCVHQCRGPPSCFLNTFPTHPQVTGATAGYRLQPAPELHPASIGSGPLHAGGTTPPSNGLRGQQLSLLQDYAFTTFRRRPPTTTENRADNATHHDFYNFYNFDVNQVQHLGI